MRLVLPALLLLGGCLSGNYNGADMHVGAQDMAKPQPPPPDMLMLFVFDLSGVDLGGLTNCKALNQCEQMAANAVQGLACEKMATPPARAKEASLQNCFHTYCPVVADMGMGRCAANDMGKVSNDCQTCVNNTYVASGGSCTPPDAPECHQCLAQANVCAADQ